MCILYITDGIKKGYLFLFYTIFPRELTQGLKLISSSSFLVGESLKFDWVRRTDFPIGPAAARAKSHHVTAAASRGPVSLNVWKGSARPVQWRHPAHEGKMAAALERSFIEICGFERETLNRFREVTVNLGELPTDSLRRLRRASFLCTSWPQMLTNASGV